MNRIAFSAWLGCALVAGWLLGSRAPLQVSVVADADPALLTDDAAYMEAAYEPVSETVVAQLEQALYSEHTRLLDQLAQLQPGIPGQPELFFLGIAGDGTQRVFGREVDFVRQQLAQRYALDGHSLLLINDRERIGTTAMATRTSVQQALQTFARQMNPDEDVLLLYLTTHGSEDHYLMLDQEGMLLPDLAAQELSAWLEDSGIRWQVVILSACFSGGAVPLLQHPDRLVMTSAAADRSSFGCTDDADLTYFGRALFEQAFPVEADWPAMFDRASRWIEQREAQEDMTPSRPQLAAGERILQQLAQLPRQEATP